MPVSENHLSQLDFIVDRVNVGILVIDRKYNITRWNKFLEMYSGKTATDVVGKGLFECFDDLPRVWLEKKINSVLLLKNFSFTSWEQRPYLFRFKHNRPVTGGKIDYMRQNCTFLPIKDAQGEVEYICITIQDVTDNSIYQRMLQDTKSRLEEMSVRDGLTGLYNRRYSEDRLDAEFNRVKRYGGTLSILLFDLDHFKKINDTYGHQAGDEVLRTVADRVRRVLRGTDICGRYGGEEFIVILPNSELAGATRLGDRLRNIMASDPVQCRDLSIPVTISVGVSETRLDMPTYETIVHQADLALYASKERGRNCVTNYEDLRPAQG
jgi:diguanylate cyclase (GGDEF)-like protein/PAS domain S-box-containing protein